MGMTNEEAINTLKSLKSYYNDKSEYCKDRYIGFDNEDNEALDMAIKALEQQSCDDCISRAYIESIVEELENICINGDEHILSLLSNIKNAPSVTPSRPKGKWMDDNCSICGYGVKPWNNTPYCPNCGAKMTESEVNADEACD